MGPMMNLGFGGPMMQMRQAAPGMMQGSLNAARVAPNKLSIFDMLRKNPQALGQMGMGLMQAGQRQPMGGGGMQGMIPLMQGLLQRRG
jgi:hypothetical protein